MLNRDKLERSLRNKFVQIGLKRDKAEELYTFCKEKYNVDKMTTGSYVSGNTALAVASKFILYALLDGVEHCLDITKSEIQVYFTENEISTFRGQKLKTEPLFPIVFENIVKIDENHWIGKVTAKTILKFMDNGLIRYNTETQRAVTIVTKNGEEHWEITINNRSVNEISKDMLDGTFISNMITLNIPEDDFDAKFNFDEKKHRFVIKKLNHFDVTDGFHRIIAMQHSQSYHDDFDYNMELRITCFSKERACRFIRQEDQKTHMSKIQSKAMDVSDHANTITTKLNENPASNISGMITKYVGQIKYAELSEAIRRFYFPIKRIQRDSNKAYVIKVSQSLMKNINALTELYPDLLDKTYCFIDLCAMIYEFYSNEHEERLEKEVYEETYNVLKYLETYDIKKLSIKPYYSSAKKISNAIESIKKEMYNNV